MTEPSFFDKAKKHATQAAAKPTTKRATKRPPGIMGQPPPNASIALSNRGQCQGKECSANPRRQSMDGSTSSSTPVPGLLTHLRHYLRNLHV